MNKKNLLFYVFFLIILLLFGSRGYGEYSFFDDFSSGTLDPVWQVVEFTGTRVYGYTTPANHYSLTDNPGYLRYILDPMTHQDGYINGFQTTYSQHSCCNHDPGLEFHRAISGNYWTFETKVNYYMPYTNGRCFGVKIYFGDGGSGTQYVTFERWRDVNQNHLRCMLVDKYGASLDDQTRVENVSDPVYDINDPAEGTLYFKLEREGPVLTALWSADGNSWTTFFSVDMADQLDGLEQWLVITGGSWYNTGGSYADYDYVQLTSDTTTGCLANVPENGIVGEEISFQGDSGLDPYPPLETTCPGNLAHNPSRTGFPHPLESDNGWGGGADKWDIVEGTRNYSYWGNGLAFTGGTAPYVEPCGWRQATINFGEAKTFNKVLVWHHGSEHIPNTYKLQYWDGAAWVDIMSTTNGHSFLKYPADPPDDWWEAWSTPTENTFPAVTSDKVRIEINNCDITHGWIYEFEVLMSPVFEWDFGDGSPPSNEQNPTHIYNAEGTYTWTMIVDYGDSFCWQTGEVTIAPVPTVTVTCPNGGESYEVGSLHDITWTSTGPVAEVRIDYSHDNGQNWIEIVSASENDGSYTWTIPDTVSSQCLLKVSDTAGDPSDMSDSVFTIEPAPEITVTSPNGGEVWEAGSAHDITWTSVGNVGNVRIEFSNNNGAGWSTIVSSTENDGSHPWTAALIVSTQCLIRISETDNDPTDSSDAVFAVLPSSTGIPQSERGALIALYNSTNGDAWSDNSGWKSPPLHTDGFAMPGTENTWFGVTCNVSNTTVEAVVLRGNNLEGTIPDAAADLTNLVELDLASNLLGGTIPGTLGNLTNLRYLWLYNNALTGAIPPELGNCGSLRYLWLMNNQLTGSIPPELGNLTNLEFLFLEHNQLSENIPLELGNLTALEFLHLNANILSGEIPLELSYLEQLLDTDIGYNALYSADETLRPFLDEKDPDWESTQTVTPGNVAAEVLTDTSIEVSWTPIVYTDHNGGYMVYYSTVSGGPHGLFDVTADKAVSSITVTGLEPDTPYYFVVGARTGAHDENDNIVESENSMEVSATTTVIDSLTVNSPNGGESWQAGSQQNLAWTGTGNIEEVHIEYSTDSGDTWAAIAAFTANDGSFNWTVPDTPSDTCLLRIRAGDGDEGSSDVSDGVFSIVSETAPTITVLSPNGGETLTSGSIHEIKWTSTGVDSLITIRFTADRGATWTLLAEATENDGSFNWTIPDTQSENCFVQISTGDSDAGPMDLSNAPFTIVPDSSTFLHVISPNGGEKYYTGFTYGIAWTGSSDIANVKIEYSTDSGDTWTMIIDSTENTGSYNWITPDTPSGNCLIRISDTAGSATDVSDGVFEIAQPAAITVTSPNGGEVLTAGAACEITWTSSDGVDCVRIEYSIDGGETWTVISAAENNTGAYNWNVPAAPSPNCLIRVSGCDGDAAPSDVSDAPFTIQENI